MNGKPYVIGESVEWHGLITQRNGAACYTHDYYGVLAAASLGLLYERGQEIKLFGSHPPGDVKFRQDLMEAVIGDWAVEIGGSELNFHIGYANTFDEPVGGLMNVLLTEFTPILSRAIQVSTSWGQISIANLITFGYTVEQNDRSP